MRFAVNLVVVAVYEGINYLYEIGQIGCYLLFEISGKIESLEIRFL